MKTSSLLIILIIALALLGGMFYFFPPYVAENITTFEECAAKYAVMESYPEQCLTPDGTHFTRDIGNELEKSDFIRVSFPRPGETVISPLVIKGEARGYWFFEASFPVVLVDEKGNEIASGPAQADGDWMTEDFVPFTATLTFAGVPERFNGKLFLKKDNPSGLPENDDALVIPLVVEQKTEVALPDHGCFVGGCSGEVCSEDPDAVSTCIYRPEYQCYQNATCERQTNDTCGWTQTDTLKKCLMNPETEGVL